MFTSTNRDLFSAVEKLRHEILSSNEGAKFSNDRRYRYLLWRQWAGTDKLILFIALNPSTADETVDDPTIRRCRGYAKNWDASGFLVANLFAFRATFPQDLLAADDPVGSLNDNWLKISASLATQTVVCWGNHGSHHQRSLAVLNLLPTTFALKVNKSGQPCHPLYLPGDLKPIVFPKRAELATNSNSLLANSSQVDW